jgi:hypothetical protein
MRSKASSFCAIIGSVASFLEKIARIKAGFYSDTNRARMTNQHSPGTSWISFNQFRRGKKSAPSAKKG